MKALQIAEFHMIICDIDINQTNYTWVRYRVMLCNISQTQDLYDIFPLLQNTDKERLKGLCKEISFFPENTCKQTPGK